MKDKKNKNYMQLIKSYRIMFGFMAIFAMAGSLLYFGNSAEASNPSSGSISPANGNVKMWAGTLTGAPPAAMGESTCDTTALNQNCDLYTLTVTGNPADWVGFQIRIQLNWQLLANDYDMTIRKEDGVNPGLQGDGVGAVGPFDPIAGTSGNGTNTIEEVVITPSTQGTGVYYIRSIYFAAAGLSDPYQGSAKVETVAVSGGGGSGGLTPSACAVPSFDNYQPPVGYSRRDSAGEPSIGVNWNTGNVMTMSRLQGNRTTFNDSTSPANPNTTQWFAYRPPNIVTGLDPILFTDQVTGRTIGGELVAVGGATDGFVSDDDLSSPGINFTTGGAVQGFDHQTIGGGPPKVDPSNPVLVARQPLTSYPNLFYYASQQIAYGSVSTSFDGGNTYGSAVTAYTLAECGGLHGHLRVAPDGTVYLPNKNCGGKAAVVVSENNGLTWSVRPIPSSTVGRNDPSVGIGAGGKVYVSYTGSNKHPRVAVSDDRGLTWHDDVDLALGTTPNLTTAVFPAVVAGDNDRAMVFFIATDSTNLGDPTGDDTSGIYAGTWYPYVAYTCDGGKSWSVVKADNDPLRQGVPNPVQQGVVCTNGTTCPAGTRNLLDFNDFTVDSRGRGLATYADGCNFDHPCSGITDNSGTKAENQGIARLTIIRQRGGMRLFSAFDAAGPAAPSLSPPVNVSSQRSGYNLSWATPDDNGSPITSYKVYRGLPGGSEQMIAEVSGSENSFIDRRFGSQNNRGIYYRVTATNQFGESPRDVKFYAKDGIRTKANKNATEGRGLGE